MNNVLTLPRSLRPVRVTINGEPLIKAFDRLGEVSPADDYNPPEWVFSIRDIEFEKGQAERNISKQWVYMMNALFVVAKDNHYTVDELIETYRERIEQPMMRGMHD